MIVSLKVLDGFSCYWAHLKASYFDNNWISFHQGGTIVTYPMYAPSRREERRLDIIQYFKDNFEVKNQLDLDRFEAEDLFLEGTGSMILDRDARIAYACRSMRTDDNLFHDFCSKLDYKPVLFDSSDESEQPIYHTNVIMCVTTSQVIVCLESVKDPGQLKMLKETILNSGKEIVDETYLSDVLDLNVFVDAISTNNRSLLQMPALSLQEGKPAEICVFDRASKWVYDEKTNLSKCDNSPIILKELKAKHILTLN